MDSWMQGANMSSLYASVRVLACLLCLYHIWYHRNEMLHDESRLSSATVISRIKHHIGELAKKIIPKKGDSKEEAAVLLKLDIIAKHPMCRAR